MSSQSLTTVVIGGGWAGIAAAVEATADGTVIVVEERPYLGGRARSFQDKTMHHQIDNGQHVMMGCYHETLRMLETLGTAHLLRRQRALRVAFVQPNTTMDVLDASALPGSAGIAVAIMRLGNLRLSSRIAVLSLAAKIRLGIVTGRGLTCSEFFAKHAQPNDAIERFWEPIVLATVNAPITNAPAELLFAVMKLAFLGSRTDAQMLIPTCGLSDLLAPFPEWLRQRGGSVYLSTSADAIVPQNINGTMSAVVQLSSGETLVANRVISAIPQRALRRLLSNSSSDVVLPAEPPASPIVSVYLWYNSGWMPVDFASAIGTTIQWVFDKQNLHPGLVAVTVSAGASIVARDAGSIIALCDEELRRCFPQELGSVELLHGQVIKEKQATPLFTPANIAVRVLPDHVAVAHPYLRIAGDWTQTQLPATIEGAVQSGVSAARAAREQVNTGHQRSQ